MWSTPTPRGSAFDGAGLGPDSKIGLFLYNGNEYLEAHYAAFKMRGVPVKEALENYKAEMKDKGDDVELF